MTIKLRFLLLAVFNCGLIVGLFYLFSQYQVELSKRLVDLNLDNPMDRQVFFTFILLLVGAFLGNFIFLSIQNHDFTKREMTELAALLRP